MTYPGLLTSTEAMAYLGISSLLLYRLIEANVLRGIRISGEWYFSEKRLDRCITRQTISGRQPKQLRVRR